MTNSTVSGNDVTHSGGGLFVRDDFVDLLFVTITNNTADSDGNGTGNGGGIAFNSSGTYVDFTASHTIIADNFDDAPESTSHPDCSAPEPNGEFETGVIGYVDHSLIGDDSGCNLAYEVNVNNLIGSEDTIDPGLDPLGENGGPTATHALQSDSVAIDAGNDSYGCGEGWPCEDQRGVPLRAAPWATHPT